MLSDIFYEMWLSDLFVRLQDVGVVSPLRQDDGIHVFPVQTATLQHISRRLRWGEFILKEVGKKTKLKLKFKLFGRDC